MRRGTAAIRAAVVMAHTLAAVARLGVRLAARSLAGRGETRAGLLGRTLAELCQALGPCYVKLGQLLSTRRDLLPEGAIRHLARLQDGLPPGPFAWVSALFRRELHREIGDVFAELDPTAVASASVATVYRGRLRDGRVVALKVQRPEVARLIRTDLRLLKGAASVLARLPPLRLVPVVATVDDLCRCLERQLDFGREAASSRRLGAALRCEPGVVVPELVDELCSPSILTMEFIEHLRPPDGRGGEAARRALRSGVRALYRMIFVEGCIHCDLHHGNLGLLADGRAALLDFGFVAEIGDQARLQFAEFFYAMATNDGARCARITRDAAVSVPPDLDYEAFQAEVVALVDSVSRVRASDFRVAAFVGRLFDLQRRHRLRGTSDFVMPILSLLVLEGIVKDVYSDLDFQREAQPYVLRASIRGYVPSPAVRTAPELMGPGWSPRELADALVRRGCAENDDGGGAQGERTIYSVERSRES